MLKPSQTKSVLNELELGRIAGGYAIMLEGFARADPDAGSVVLEKTKVLSKTRWVNKRRKETLERRKAITIINVTRGMSNSPVSHIEEAFPSVRRIKEMSPHEEQKRTNDSALMQAMKLIENQQNAEAFEKIVAKSREKLDKQIASGSTKP